MIPRLLIVFLAFLACPVLAHIGSPNTVCEGLAGPYPVRVIVRPPGVVPGLAEILVRTLSGPVEQVSVLPVYGRAGRSGSPPPDEALPVRGETNLYSTTLWLMKAGAYNIEVAVKGSAGEGRMTTPVNSLAFATRQMSTGMKILLLGLGSTLFLSAVMLVGILFGEAGLPAGAKVDARTRRRSWIAMAVGIVFFSTVLYGAKMWWDAEERDYRTNRLYQPVPMEAAVREEQGQRVLQLEIKSKSERNRDWTPLIPDHGKMMHLFLIREPDLKAFAHLHPVAKSKRKFETAIPPLPAGTYKVYADVTHENGLTQTLVASVEFPEGEFAPVPRADIPKELICGAPAILTNVPGVYLLHDPEDSWHYGAATDLAGGKTDAPLVDGLQLVWESPGSIHMGKETTLRFKVVHPERGEIVPEPYMGMEGHAVVRRQDGAVFAHLHPMGTISMAAQKILSGSERDDVKPHKASGVIDDGASISFPYEFPQPGPYRIWVQTKINRRVMTGAFDVQVGPGKTT